MCSAGAPFHKVSLCLKCFLQLNRFENEEQVEDLEYGVETVFIVYLHLLTKLPMPQVLQVQTYDGLLTTFPYKVFLISFFCLFLMVGLATQFFQIDLIISAIHDNFWTKLNKYLKSREILSMLIVSLGFLLW